MSVKFSFYFIENYLDKEQARFKIVTILLASEDGIKSRCVDMGNPHSAMSIKA